MFKRFGSVGLSLALVFGLCAAFTGCANSQQGSDNQGSGISTDAVSTDDSSSAEASDDKGVSDEYSDQIKAGNTCKYINTYFSNLADAVEQANQNGGGTIELFADTTASADGEPAIIAFRTSIIIKSVDGQNFTVKRSAGQSGEMLRISDGTIKLKDVTFDGTGTATSPIIMVSDQAYLTLQKGVTLTGNKSDGSGSDAALAATAISVSGSDAHLILKSGVTIKDNVGTGAALAAIVNNGANVENDGAMFSGNTGSNSNPNYFDSTGSSAFTGTEIS